MASIPVITQLKVEDFPALTAASKDETDKLFRALNSALTGIVQALTRSLTFADNLKAFTKTLTVQNGTTKIQNTLGIRPLGVLVMEANDTTNSTPAPVAAGPVAWAISSDQIAISAISGLTAGHTYKITFLVVGA